MNYQIVYVLTDEISGADLSIEYGAPNAEEQYKPFQCALGIAISVDCVIAGIFDAATGNELERGKDYDIMEVADVDAACAMVRGEDDSGV